MMATIALPRLKINRATVLRGVALGSTWGATVAAALLGLSFYKCGVICLGQIVETTALSIAAGMLAIGPLAALRPADAASPQ